MLFYLCLQHMCSLESEFESQMGEFHVKMKGKRHPSLAFLIAPLALCVSRAHFSLPHFVSFRPGWFRTFVCRWPVWGRKCTLTRTHCDAGTKTLQPAASHLSPHQPIGSDALREAAVEAARPRGSQQQADMGQRRVHLSASRHGIAVNQGRGISLPGAEHRQVCRAALLFCVKHPFLLLFPRWRSWRAWPITWWWGACPAKCSTFSARSPKRWPWTSTTLGRWSWIWRSPGGAQPYNPNLHLLHSSPVSTLFSFLLLSSPFDKDDQISSSSTVSKRLLSNQSPPDTPSMREQVFYVSRSQRAENSISSLHICCDFSLELMSPLLSLHWLVFQLFPHFFVCCGGAGTCEDSHSGLCIRALATGAGEHAAQRMNASSSEPCENSSMYEGSCGPCSCLIVVE